MRIPRLDGDEFKSDNSVYTTQTGRNYFLGLKLSLANVEKVGKSR
jgi:hypothetical protein